MMRRSLVESHAMDVRVFAVLRVQKQPITAGDLRRECPWAGTLEAMHARVRRWVKNGYASRSLNHFAALFDALPSMEERAQINALAVASGRKSAARVAQAERAAAPPRWSPSPKLHSRDLMPWLRGLV